jgi:hypothetical protein
VARAPNVSPLIERSTSDTRDEGTQDSPNRWKRGEKKLREREIKFQVDGVKLQREGEENQRKERELQLFTAVAAVVAASEGTDETRPSVTRRASRPCRCGPFTS